MKISENETHLKWITKKICKVDAVTEHQTLGLSIYAQRQTVHESTNMALPLVHLRVLAGNPTRLKSAHRLFYRVLPSSAKPHNLIYSPVIQERKHAGRTQAVGEIETYGTVAKTQCAECAHVSQ